MKKISIDVIETKTIIIPEKIWMETWKQTGSSERASKHLKKIGYKKIYKKPITPQVVLSNAWTWAIYHPKEFRELLDKEREKAKMSSFEDNEFNVMLIKRAMSVLNTRLRHFSHWIEINDYQEYNYIYERRFPRIARKHKGQLEEANSQAVSV